MESGLQPTWPALTIKNSFYTSSSLIHLIYPLDFITRGAIFSNNCNNRTISLSIPISFLFWLCRGPFLTLYFPLLLLCPKDVWFLFTTLMWFCNCCSAEYAGRSCPTRDASLFSIPFHSHQKQQKLTDVIAVCSSFQTLFSNSNTVRVAEAWMKFANEKGKELWLRAWANGKHCYFLFQKTSDIFRLNVWQRLWQHDLSWLFRSPGCEQNDGLCHQCISGYNKKQHSKAKLHQSSK